MSGRRSFTWSPMKIDRRFTKAGQCPFSQFEYVTYDCLMKHHRTGEVILDIKDCLVPKTWSKNARDTLIGKYFRKAGVPDQVRRVSGEGVPKFLERGEQMPGVAFLGERSVKQVIQRIVGHWTYTGYLNGYFDAGPGQQSFGAGYQKEHPEHIREQNACAYHDEMIYMMLAQMGAPNSPQWFNTGLWWAYGITGEPQGHWYVDGDGIGGDQENASAIACGDVDQAMQAIRPHTHLSQDAFSRVQASACFILGVSDSMLGDGGITDWYDREARIFKFGSGSGVNLSKLRGKNEPLSGGGKSSGVMPFMETSDRSAGAIKSGGTTRRAAKMVCLDLDHPDIKDFIQCKVDSEIAVAAMATGSYQVNRGCQAIMDAVIAGNSAAELTESAQARGVGVPESYLQKARDMASQGVNGWPAVTLDTDFEGLAYAIAPYQNSNNSVRIPTSFYESVDHNGQWTLLNRIDGRPCESIPARQMETLIATAAWFCGDPGVQYDTTINEWNVTPMDGRIDASNPCSEHMRLNNSACNLASIRLMPFLVDGVIDYQGYSHAIRLWTITLDITNTMAHLPSREAAMSVFAYRDIGLGFADLGALIMAMALPYDSEEARAVAGAMSALLAGEAHLTSALLAKSLGAYPRFHVNKNDHLRCVYNHMQSLSRGHDKFLGLTVSPQRMSTVSLATALGKQWCDLYEHIQSAWRAAYALAQETGLRNAELTVIAPTGTIGIVMDCDTTGVEPLFALKTFKQLVGGGSMTMDAVASVGIALKKIGRSDHEIQQATGLISKSRSISGYLDPMQASIFATALSSDPNIPAIPWEAHIRMMAAVQPFISGAISKTVNMPSACTIDEVKEAYRLGHDLGCKSIALYRDGSKLSQPLTVTKSPDSPAPAATEKTAFTLSPPALTERVRLGCIREAGISVAVVLGPGTLYVHTDRYDGGKCAEIWATYSADQGIIQALISTLCRTANVSLQYGVPLDVIVNSWVDSNFSPSGFVGGHPYIKTCRSVVNLLARILDYHELGNTHALNVQPAVSADEPAAFVEDPGSYDSAKLTGETCPECGSVNYVQSGAGCRKCVDCGFSGGCG